MCHAFFVAILANQKIEKRFSDQLFFTKETPATSTNLAQYRIAKKTI
jgi:hypothetical protein